MLYVFHLRLLTKIFKKFITPLGKTSETDKRNVSETFNYAWNIFDYTNRISDLLHQLPCENKDIILGDLYHLKDVRNTFQHLGVRNSAVLKKHTPFFWNDFLVLSKSCYEKAQTPLSFKWS
jgi:hypothetical protein